MKALLIILLTTLFLPEQVMAARKEKVLRLPSEVKHTVLAKKRKAVAHVTQPK